VSPNSSTPCAVGACLVCRDRNADAFFLADDPGTGWRRSAARAGAPLENAACRVVPGESRISFETDRVTVEFAVQFLELHDPKLVYAYANAFGNTRNTVLEGEEYLSFCGDRLGTSSSCR